MSGLSDIRLTNYPTNIRRSQLIAAEIRSLNLEQRRSKQTEDKHQNNEDNEESQPCISASGTMAIIRRAAYFALRSPPTSAEFACDTSLLVLCSDPWLTSLPVPVVVDLPRVLLDCSCPCVFIWLVPRSPPL